MANYPTSDPSFPTRTNGGTIDASHVNVVGDEVVAIGTAIRGTLSHGITIGSTHSLNVGGNSTLTGSLSAGASTVASLHVTGASTLAGAVVFGASVTLSSGATVSTGVIRQNSLPMWNVFHSTHVTYASGATAGANFDSQDYVRGSIAHSTTANSSRVTVNTTGIYHVGYRAAIGSTGARAVVSFVFNDSTALLRGAYLDRTDDVRTGYLSVTGDLRVDSTGYLTVQVHSTEAASTLGSSSAFDAERFYGHFIG